MESKGTNNEKQTWKKTKLEDSHFPNTFQNLLQSYNNQNKVLLA